MNGFRFWQYLLLLINNCTSYQSITAVLISSFDEAHIDFGTSSVKTGSANMPEMLQYLALTKLHDNMKDYNTLCNSSTL